ncbi:MAG: hypothetical protein ACOVO1_06110 [Chitinophagaceae bacterium]
MKKIIFTVITVLSLANAQGQFEKGSKWIAGAANISANTSENDQSPWSNNKSNSITIGFRPSINTFVSDKVMNTLFLGYMYNSAKSDNNISGNVSKRQIHKIQFGFGKTHLNPLFGKVYSTITTNFYGEYSYDKNEYISNTGLNVIESKQNGYSANANIGLGLMYRASDRFAITTTLNNFLYGAISSNNGKNNSTGTVETTTKGFGIDGGFGLSGFNLGNLQFGLIYRLKGKK